MIQELQWSDNVCTVGWTCIHAYMVAADMRWLLERCPDGTFTPTFYRLAEEGGPVLTPEEAEKLEGPRGFYFNFPLDMRGEALLAELGLR